MKKLFLAALVCCSCVWTGVAAEAVAQSVPEPVVAAAASTDEMRPLSQWTPFQIVFFPNVPSATWNSNVFGIKTGQPASGGIGRVYGLEASWVFSGTDHIKGFQGCWVYCQNQTCDGIQAAFVSCLNFKEFRGLQATLVYCLAGDIKGAQGSLVSMAGNVAGVQGGLALNISKDITGFQAAGVNVVDGTLRGVQCGLYSQVKESRGLQLGLVNISQNKGFQFGLFNYIENSPIPFLPIMNFYF